MPELCLSLSVRDPLSGPPQVFPPHTLIQPGVGFSYFCFDMKWLPGMHVQYFKRCEKAVSAFLVQAHAYWSVIINASITV